MKKILFALGTVASAAIPVTVMIACSSGGFDANAKLQKAKVVSTKKIKTLKLNATDKTAAENLVKKVKTEDELESLVGSLVKHKEDKKELVNNSFDNTKDMNQYKEIPKDESKLDEETVKELNEVLGLNIKVVTYKNLITSVDGILTGTIEMDFIARKSGNIGDVNIDSGQEVNIVLTPPKLSEDNSIVIKIMINGRNIQVSKETGIPVVVKLLNTFTKNAESSKEITI